MLLVTSTGQTDEVVLQNISRVTRFFWIRAFQSHDIWKKIPKRSP